MKTLSGCKAPRCDKHQFCDKMTVSTWTVFEISLLYFRNRTLLRLAVFRVAFGHLWVLLIIKALKEEDWALKWKSGFQYCVHCASAPSLHRESTDSLISSPRVLTAVSTGPNGMWNLKSIIVLLCSCTRSSWAPLETFVSKIFTSSRLVSALRHAAFCTNFRSRFPFPVPVPVPFPVPWWDLGIPIHHNIVELHELWITLA